MTRVHRPLWVRFLIFLTFTLTKALTRALIKMANDNGLHPARPYLDLKFHPEQGMVTLLVDAGREQATQPVPEMRQ